MRGCFVKDVIVAVAKKVLSGCSVTMLRDGVVGPCWIREVQQESKVSSMEKVFAGLGGAQHPAAIGVIGACPDRPARPGD